MPGSGNGSRTGSGSTRHGTPKAAGILAEVRRVVDEELTAHQRRVFGRSWSTGYRWTRWPPRLGLRRNAIYKVIFDARRKIRRALVANGYLEELGREQR